MPPNSKILLKKGKIYTRRGGARPKPSEEKQTKKKNLKKNYYRLRKSVNRQTKSTKKFICS
jgi:hypothetical protein